MDLSQRVTSFGQGSQKWLGSAHATDTAETGTIDIASFATLLGSTFTNGFIPSGVFLGVITATQKLGPYNDAALDGRQTAVGILFEDVQAKTGDTNDKVCAYIWHGQVITALLPTGNGGDAAGRTDLKNINFV